MKKILKKASVKGQALAEYGLIIAAVAVVAITNIELIGTNLTAALAEIAAAL